MRPRGLARRFAPLALLALAPTASAHGFGGGEAAPLRFVLPPWIAWVTGAAVVALSFVVVAAYLTRHERPRPLAAPDAPRPAGAAAFVALAVLLAATLPAFSSGSSSSMPAVVLWLLAWSALPLVSYLAVDAWPRIDPLAALGALADRARGARAPLRRPPSVGAWPAVALVVALTGLEVASQGLLGVQGLARILLAYLGFSFLGMLACGSAAWRERADPFGRMFALWGAMAPFARSGRRWRARTPGAGLDGARVSGADGVALVVALLYAVNFDGFLGTRAGALAYDALAARAGTALAFVALLVGGYAIFLGAFWLCAVAIRRWSETLRPTGEIAARFAPALVPIAAGYHLAHYLPYLVEASPRLLHAIADPLGVGPAPPDIAFSPAWAAAASAFQLVAIVAGHVLAVAVAHRLALRAFPSRLQALRGEVPLTGVMVAYTLVGLWIVSATTGSGGWLP